MGEFARIRKISRDFRAVKNPLSRTVKGIGDDAAVIENNLLVTTDALADGVHFDSRRVNFAGLGYKAFAVNISDIAAMGGYPVYALLTLGIPKGLQDGCLTALIKGMRQCAAKYSVELVGGDTIASAGIFLSVTIIGKPYRRPIFRGGAKPGDHVYVTGTIGDSAIGLALIRGSLDDGVSDKKYFIARHDRPEPRVWWIKTLLGKYRIHSCIDISDGLLQDLGHIAEESKTGLSVDLDKIPLSEKKIGKSYRDDPMVWRRLAAGGGEDYELLFTSPDKIPSSKEVPVTKIGSVTAGKDGIRYFYNGKRQNSGGWKKGYEHF